MSSTISIFGAGYIGSVSAACLSKLGKKVILVDIDPHKIKTINSGHSHIVEPGLEELLQENVAQGLISATSDVAQAIAASSLSFICVGTPCKENGSLNLDYIFRVIRQIATALISKTTFHIIAIRSTVLPGTIAQCIEIIEGVTQKKHGIDFGICSNPEFLREGSAIADYFNPPYTLVGSDDPETLQIMQETYAAIEAPFYATATKVAELLKYINNSFHALKVVFGNEVGNICKKLGIDSHQVMDLFCKDQRLNISPYYLKPGFAFGGSCLPKDLSALCYLAKSNDLEVPMLNQIMPSNQLHIQKAVKLISTFQKRRVGLIGLSFKAGTDDLRESPLVTLTETLIGKGFQLQIYDPHVSLSKIHGSNKEYLESHIPHINELIVPPEKLAELIDFAEIIIIGNKEKSAFTKIAALIGQSEKQIVDLVRIEPTLAAADNYTGICW